MAEVEAGVEQSEVLSQEEVTEIVEGAPTGEPEVQLESEKSEFEVPDKFQGKSLEEVIKSYQELEKMQKKEVIPESKEGEEPLEPEEGGKDGEITDDVYDKYADSFDKNGELSEAEYAELDKLGFNKEAVDKEIADRQEVSEFEKYKQEKALDVILEPLGGGKEKFKAVADWANENKTEAEVEEFNKALAASAPLAQQALLKSLYADYDSSSEAEDTVLHTNSTQKIVSKGYSTQEEFFKDVGSEEYQNNPKYRAAVEAKMAKSDIF